MKEKSTKRLENKKKKMAALLEIAKLNEQDRLLRKSQVLEKTDGDNSELEPSPNKKLRTEIEIDNVPASSQELINGLSCKPQLSGDEYLELKRMLREKTSKLRQQPWFKLRDVGVSATLTTDFENRVPLFFPEIVHLIMYSQLGHFSPYSPTRWCNLEKYNKVPSTCLLIVENVSLFHFTNNESLFPFTSATFETKLEVLKPSNCDPDYVKNLSMVPLTGTQMRKLIHEFGSLDKAVEKTSEVFDAVKDMFPVGPSSESGQEQEEAAAGGGGGGVKSDLPPSDRFARTKLLLSGWQMIEENYPMPIKGLMERKFAGYVLTQDRYNDVTPSSKMFGLDCEMCMTSINDLELTRVSVVDENLKTIYDTLVRPDNKITDYLTRYSGITAKMMKPITKHLKDVQDDLRTLLPKDAILVGQSLCNDLHALKMMHPYIIDTSIIFNLTGDRSRKTKLKVLSQEFLKETIQNSRGGHCSTEDSLAALKLVQLKLKKSLYYGDAVMGSVHSALSIHPELGTYHYATSMLRQITKHNKSCSVVSTIENATKYKFYFDKGADSGKETNYVKFAAEKTSKDVVKVVSESVKQSSLTIGHLRIQSDQLASTKVLKNTDRWVKDIYEKLPQFGLMIVLLAPTAEGNGGCFVQIKRNQ